MCIEQREQLQNTPQLIYMSLNKNSVYCVMPRSSKPLTGGPKLRGILKFSRTKARSEWSCFSKIIQSKLRNLPIKSLPVNTPFTRSQLHPAAARCHLIQPRLPSSSANSPACGQNILLLQSREFFSLETYQHPSSNFLPNSDIPYTP